LANHQKVLSNVSLTYSKEKLVKSCNTDVYMVPLSKELQLFWGGVDAWDIKRLVGHQSFKMHSILMWVIHDLLAYGLF